MCILKCVWCGQYTSGQFVLVQVLLCVRQDDELGRAPASFSPLPVLFTSGILFLTSGL
jgi:hypothetical protein